jgi:hypothetical protein
LALPNLVILDASLRKDRGGDIQIAGTRVFDIDDEVWPIISERDCGSERQ